MSFFALCIEIAWNCYHRGMWNLRWHKPILWGHHHSEKKYLLSTFRWKLFSHHLERWIPAFSLAFLCWYYHFIKKYKSWNKCKETCICQVVTTVWNLFLGGKSCSGWHQASTFPLTHPAWDSGRDFPSYYFNSPIMNGKACVSVFSISSFPARSRHKGRRLLERKAQIEAMLMNYLKSQLGAGKIAQHAKHLLAQTTRTRVQIPAPK